MLATYTRYEHVVLDENGTPVIEGTNIKIIEIVLDKLAYGWSAEEIHLQHPNLTLGQIHSALAYYWDHKDALDQDIQARFEFADRLRASARPTPLLEKLRMQGLIV